MIDSLDPTIATYIATGNSHNVQAFLACFAPDAIVVDENRTRAGAKEIEEWFHETRNLYDLTAEPISATDIGDETELVCTVSGNFPGSPVDLSYRFKLQDGKIAKLTIV